MQKFQLSSLLTTVIASLTCEKNVHYLSRQKWILSFDNEDIEYTSSNTLIARDYARKLFREKVFPNVLSLDNSGYEVDIVEVSN